MVAEKFEAKEDCSDTGHYVALTSNELLARNRDILSRELATPSDIALAWTTLVDIQNRACLDHDEKRYRKIADALDWIKVLNLPTSTADGLPSKVRGGVPVFGLDKDVRDRFMVRVAVVRDAAIAERMPWPDLTATETAPTIEPNALDNSDDWRERARQIADELFDYDTAHNTRDGLVRKNGRGEYAGGYAYRVMEAMQQRNIHGPRGRIDNAGTVAREALQGDKWWGKKNK